MHWLAVVVPTLECEGRFVIRSSEYIEEGHERALCHTRVCGHSIQGDHAGCLTHFEENPYFLPLVS